MGKSSEAHAADDEAQGVATFPRGFQNTTDSRLTPSSELYEEDDFEAVARCVREPKKIDGNCALME